MNSSRPDRELSRPARAARPRAPRSAFEWNLVGRSRFFASLTAGAAWCVAPVVSVQANRLAHSNGSELDGHLTAPVFSPVLLWVDSFQP